MRQLHSNANSPEAAAPVLQLTLYGLVHSTKAVNAAAIGADSHPDILQSLDSPLPLSFSKLVEPAFASLESDREICRQAVKGKPVLTTPLNGARRGNLLEVLPSSMNSNLSASSGFGATSRRSRPSSWQEFSVSKIRQVEMIAFLPQRRTTCSWLLGQSTHSWPANSVCTELTHSKHSLTAHQWYSLRSLSALVPRVRTDHFVRAIPVLNCQTRASRVPRISSFFPCSDSSETECLSQGDRQHPPSRRTRAPCKS